MSATLLLEKMCFLHNIEKLILVVWDFYGENMVNVITRMACIEIVWRQSEDWYFLWKFYGKINLDIVWGFHGDSMTNQLPDNLHINFTIKSP